MYENVKKRSLSWTRKNHCQWPVLHVDVTSNRTGQLTGHNLFVERGKFAIAYAKAVNENEITITNLYSRGRSLTCQLTCMFDKRMGLGWGCLSRAREPSLL